MCNYNQFSMCNYNQLGKEVKEMRDDKKVNIKKRDC